MRAIIAIVLLMTIYIASYLGMVWGWGLEPENMGWVVASYIWVGFVSMVSAFLND